MLSNIIALDNISNAKTIIEQSNKILLTAHISPDGDALGSLLGLYHYLKSKDKEVVMMVPNRYPAFFSWMTGIDDVVVMEEAKPESVQIFKSSDLIFCLDYNALNRVNGMKPLIETSKAKKIMIDHHLYPNVNCDVVISHPNMASTCELVFRFIYQLGDLDTLSYASAEAIYTGMMTDTGSFTFNSNSPETYEIIKILLEKGIDKDAIYNNVNNTYSEDRLRLLGYCIQNMEILEDCNTAIIALSRQELLDHNYKIGDIEGFVNVPMQIKHITRSVLVREDKDKVKLSFRSQGDTPVNTIAEHFGGGGHKNAAGGESYVPLNETLTKLRKVLRGE